MSARRGVLPGAQPFEGIGWLEDGILSVLCLLGAAWVRQDYVHRVLALKRRFGMRFVMMVNDSIPIYARETCDQDTARVFEDFMRRALRHVDHVLALSESTAADVRRYLASLRLPEPPNYGHSNRLIIRGVSAPSNTGCTSRATRPARTFRPVRRDCRGKEEPPTRVRRLATPDRWRGSPDTHLCLGRLGWKAAPFIKDLVETHYLNGRIHLLQDVSDFELRHLHSRCMFTVFPGVCRLAIRLPWERFAFVAIKHPSRR